MARILVGAFLALGLGIWAMKNFVATTAPDAEGNNQVEQAQEKIDEAVGNELQRAKDLGN